MHSRNCIFLIVIVSISLSESADRKCAPVQSESFIAGKVAQVDQGKPVIYNMMGSFAADYIRGAEVMFGYLYKNDTYFTTFQWIRMKVGILVHFANLNSIVYFY